MRSEENQMTQDTNIADIQNDDNYIKKTNRYRLYRIDQ